MQHFTKALDDARSAGYDAKDYSHTQIMLDPGFWQFCGKARGWDKKIVVRRGTVIGNFCAPPNSGNRGECFEEMGFGMDYMPAWNYYWHRLIDHLAEGKDADSFFKDL